MLLAAARPLLRTVALPLWVFLLCYLFLHAMPGDPADRLDSPAIPGEQAERNRKALGLDKPIPVQFVRTLASYARGDLGVSFSHRRLVVEVLAEALPFTLLLGAAALVLTYGLGLPTALFLISLPDRPRRLLDRGVLVLATLPRFWLGVMLVFLLHNLAGWLPASHAFSPGGGGLTDHLVHLILPALTLCLPTAAVVSRYQLTMMEETLGTPHVRAARAAGTGGLRLICQHVLRPSLGPTLSLFALNLPGLVSGAIVVEVIFAWPGVGRLTAEAVLGSDYPLALASALLTAAAVILGRLVAELMARAVNPRQADAQRESA